MALKIVVVVAQSPVTHQHKNTLFLLVPFGYSDLEELVVSAVEQAKEKGLKLVVVHHITLIGSKISGNFWLPPVRPSQSSGRCLLGTW